MQVKDENEYEDLLAEWSDLESGLGIILGHPDKAQQFVARVVQYDRWMQGLLQRDSDAGLYLLFQLAGNSPVGYSAAHALVCAVLCHLTAKELRLPPQERDSLVRAALTMNVAMTQMQDVLANQTDKPTPLQQEMIRVHPIKGAMMLGNMGVQDENWLEVVSDHHSNQPDTADFYAMPVTERLARVLKMVDRYAAMISPRLSRAGRSATESARAVMATNAAHDEVGNALMQVVGLCPPGSFVRMESDELGVVLRRGSKPDLPQVAIVGSADGQLLRTPRLHATAETAPRIRSALAASAVRAQLNHYQILCLAPHT